MKPPSAPSFPPLLSIGLGIFSVLVVVSRAIDPLQNKIAETVFGVTFLVSILLIAFGGVQFIAKSQQIPARTVLIRVCMYMFLPAISITIILVALGYIFHWPGINPQ